MAVNNNRKNSLQELLKQVRFLSTMFDNVGSYVFAKNIDGNYVYVNEDMAKALHTPINEVIGKNDNAFFDPSILKVLHKDDLNVLLNKVSINKEQRYTIHTTGKVFIHNIIKKPIFNDDGDVIGIFGIVTDITKQKILEKENREQQQLLNTILNNIGACVYMKDHNRRLRYVNTQAAKLIGKSVSDIIGKRDTDIMPPNMADHFWESEKKVFAQNKKIVSHDSIINLENKQCHYLSTKVPYKIDANNQYLIGISTDVTELYQLKEKFKRLANIDELTGLYNRRYFFENAKREFNRVNRYNGNLAIISIDVDHFKAINDQYGHPIGDLVLIQIAKILTPTTRDGDVLARIGGEEFSILLPSISKSESKIAAERIRKLIDKTPIIIENNLVLSIKVSVGVSIYKEGDTSIQDIYARSDMALYKAKSIGRNQVYMID